MRQLVANLALVVGAGGCSIIYNPNNITKPVDSAIDSPADASIDADPNNLKLTDARPLFLDEGQGDFGSRPEILVVQGSNFVSGVTVSIVGAMPVQIDVDNAHLVLASAADYIAVPVTAHVDGTLGESVGPIALTIQVSQPATNGPVMATLPNVVSLHPHDELSALPATAPAADLLFSKVDVAAALTITPGATNTTPYAIRVVSSITVGNLTAKGGNGNKATPGGAGPNGCGGAAPVANASCPGGGKAGTSTTLSTQSGGDGGGAGFAAIGTPGTGGSGPGAGGAMVGDDLIASYASNQAAGGGGGGASLLGVGGAGGGGGGTIELTAGGDVTVGTVDVSGGQGAAKNSGGGGGGGAGGIIMLRAGGALTASTLTAVGGGGTGGTANDGTGSVGRIRWDAPAGAAPSATPVAVRGPAFVTATPLVMTTASLQLVGAPNHQFSVYHSDSGGQHNDAAGSFDGSGNATITPQLGVGFDRVCITLMGGMQGAPEADKCVDVAYLP